MTTPDSPLEHLIGAYLNQDVWEVHATVKGGVDAYVRDAPDLANALALEIDELVEALDEDELADLVQRLGAGFVPGEGGYRGWLEHTAAQVRSAGQR